MDFNTVLNKRLKKIETVLAKKGQEYATQSNRFHNFDVAARMMNTTRESALMGMMAKHWVSVMDMIDTAEFNDELLNPAQIDEKIGDSINYLILLEGMLLERVAVNNRCCWNKLKERMGDGA